MIRKVFVWLEQNGVGHWLGQGIPEGEAGLGDHAETCEGKDATDLPVEKPKGFGGLESMMAEQRYVARQRGPIWRRKCRRVSRRKSLQQPATLCKLKHVSASKVPHTVGAHQLVGTYQLAAISVTLCLYAHSHVSHGVSCPHCSQLQGPSAASRKEFILHRLP